ncbi:MAG: hypothetical protein NTV26_02670, partial [Caldiserica bacterium]|nr:hypothetical protein [Caldisericota bacterium]
LLPLATLVAFARRTEVFLAPADLNGGTDAVRTARFFFPVNGVREEDRPVIQTLSAAQDVEGLRLSLEMGRVLGGFEDMELFLFPLPAAGGFGHAPKLHIVYHGGAATAEVSDLEDPTSKQVSVRASCAGTTVTLAFDNTLIGGDSQGFFLRIEKGPGRIDITRSRTVWIWIEPTAP